MTIFVLDVLICKKIEKIIFKKLKINHLVRLCDKEISPNNDLETISMFINARTKEYYLH